MSLYDDTAFLQARILDQLTAYPDLPCTNPTISHWQQPGNAQVGNIQSATLPKVTDVVVLGSGVSACGVAKAILEGDDQKTVTILEARGLCSGATGRNGGQLTRLPPTRHTLMAERVGMAQANKIMRFTVSGLEVMHQLAKGQGPDMEEFSKFTPLEKFFAYYDEQSWKETIEAITLFEKEVPEDKGAYKLVSKEDTASIYGLKGAFGGLRFPAGVVSPYNLVTVTFDKLLSAHCPRLTIETNTPATKIIYKPDENKDYPYLVETPRGSIHASQVVHCTNGHAGHLLPGLRGRIYPRRATMSVQDPGSSFPDRRGKQSWTFIYTPQLDARDGVVETGRYYSFQNKDTGDIWIGGDRDNIDGFISADDSKIDDYANKNLRQILPKLFNPEWITDEPRVRGVWSGIMCYTGDQLPLVGKLPAIATGRGGDGEWMAGGWNTYGMTNSYLSGDALGKMMLGVDVSKWFPESYLISEQRLTGRYFSIREVLGDYFERIGANDLAKPWLST